MRVFVSNVDSPVGYALSRVLSQTVVGSRRSPEEDIPPAEETASPEEESIAKIETKAKITYQICGTLGDANDASSPGNYFSTLDSKKNAARKDAIAKFAVAGKKPAWVSDIIQNVDDKDALKAALLASDIIIYDVAANPDEAAWAVEMLSDAAENFDDHPKVFIGISTVMTWAKTKIESDDPDAFLAEDEYRRRKPHPNFKNHLAVEKNIIKFGKKSWFKTFVIASGVLYHSGDCIFHNIIKSAWLNETELLCYGEGDNVIPTIYLDDLVSIIVEVAETTPEIRYIIAVDDSKNTLFDIIKSISDNLDPGAVKKVPKEVALMNSKLSQTDIDILQLNLRLESGCTKDMSLEWKYESGLIENIQTFIQEYRDARGLSSLKVVVYGPPASGKTFFAKKLAEYYELHYLEPEEVMRDAIIALEEKLARNEGLEEPEDDFEEAKETLSTLRDISEQNNGIFPDSKILEFVKKRISSMPCQNQGYVLDGYPAKLSDAKELFKSETEDERDEKGMIVCNEKTIPDNIIALEASDSFIKTRVMKMPDALTVGTKNSEEGFLKRLEDFRADDTDETTVLNYFDELEIHPFVVSVESVEADKAFTSILKHIGKPHNYGPSAEKIAEKRRMEEERLMKEQEAQEIERQSREKEESEKHSKAVQEWKLKLEEVRKQEHDVLEAQSLPLRNYLMKFVMPTVTSGLIELCKVRPEDPIDYLAEYLFKVRLAPNSRQHNPDNA